MHAPAARLVARRADGLLVGWLAVAVWLGVFVGGRLGLSGSGWDLTWLVWVGAAVTAAHFGLSYHLAYGAGVRAAVRRHPVALGAAPLLIAVALASAVSWSLVAGPAAAGALTVAAITSVYLFTTWHYVKQVYGVGRVGAAFAGIKLNRWETWALRYALYPMWWLGAVTVLTRGSHFALAGYYFGYQWLPPVVAHLLRIAAIVAILPVAAAILTAARRARRLPSSVLLAPYAAAVLWLALPTSPVLVFLLLAPFHALQYLAVGHRAEVALASAQPGKHGLVWWLNIFGGAAAGGLLVSRWLPQLLDAHLTGGHGPLLFTAAGFVFLNLHHYLIDAVIWRSSGDLVKAVVKGPAAVPAPRDPAPARSPLPVPATAG